MAWKVIDKTSGDVFVSKSGKTLDNLNYEAKALFEKVHSSAGDLDKYEIVPTRTTYQERKEYFKDIPGGNVLSELLPYSAEQYMQGNTGYNLGTMKAGFADGTSLLGRTISSALNKSNLIGDGEFNLGQRRGEGGNIGGDILRDPSTGLLLGAGSALSKGVQYGANAGKFYLGKAFEKALPYVEQGAAKLGFTLPAFLYSEKSAPVVEQVGRFAGAAAAGAVEGMGGEALSAGLDNRELTGGDLAIGAGLGAGFELFGTVVQQLLQKYGKDYMKAAAQALRLGNTDRFMTEQEFLDFLKDPNNQDALQKVLELGSARLNGTPFAGDRGKVLEPEIQKAFDSAVETLRGQGLIDDTFYRGAIGTPAEQLEQSSAVHDMLSDMNRIEPYKDKTIWYEGRVNEMDLANPSKDIYNGRPWDEPVRSKNKRTEYLSNPEYNLEKFDDKYSAIDSEIQKYKKIKSLTDEEEGALEGLIEKYGSLENVVRRFKNTVNENALTKEERRLLERMSGKYESLDKLVKKFTSREGHITKNETDFLDKLSEEISKDYEIVNGYDPEKILSLNKFLGDRQPFNSKFLDSEVTDFLAKHPEGVSEEFASRAFKMIDDAKKYGNSRSNAIQKRWEGRYPSDIERAFSYAEGNPYDVVKGYRDAVDKFADDLSDYAKVRIGDVGKNAEGKMYIVGKDNMKKYAYSYLKKVQDALKNKGGLTADEIVTLYGEATNVNDTVVQKAILELLDNLGVPKDALKQFERTGGNYAMLNKARTRMKKNSAEPNGFSGTIMAPIVPQEGFNARNAIAFRMQRRNIDTMGGPFRNDPTGQGTDARVLFNLGLPYGVDFLNGDK